MKWLNRREVVAKVHLCYVTIWRLLKANDFPRGRNVRGKILWKESDIDAWLESPDDFVPGNKMPFPGLADGAERANVIAYLTTLE